MSESFRPGDLVTRRFGASSGIRGTVRQILRPGTLATNGGKAETERAVVDWWAGIQKETTIATSSLRRYRGGRG